MGYKYIFLFLVSIKALSYWVVSWWQHPGDPLSSIVMYRLGDIQYLPLIRALSSSQFSEFCLYEFKGKGILSLPFGSTSIHALCYGFFGLSGFILADLFIALTYYIVLTKIFIFIKIPHFLARSTSLLVVFGIPLKSIPLYHWGWDIPRHFVSEIFFLMCIYYILILTAHNFVFRRRYWFILGFSIAMLLQGDLYSTAIIIISIFLISFLLIFRKNFPDFVRRQIFQEKVNFLKGIFFIFLTFSIFSIPFFLQRIFEHPDFPRRLGVFSVDRTRLIFLYGKSTYLALLSVGIFTLVIFLFLKYLGKIEHKKNIINSILVLNLICISAFISQPVSVFLLGKAVQLYHFYEVFIRTSLLVITIFMLYSLYLLYKLFEKKFKWSKLGRSISYNFIEKLIIMTLIVISLLAIFQQSNIVAKNNKHMRADFPEYGSLKNYRNDFVMLIKELTKKEYKNCKVLGTFDHQLFSWWVSFNRGYSYTVDPLVTTVANYEIESRLINLSKIIGMSIDDFRRFFNRPYVYVFWLNHAQYQASSLHTFSHLSDYSEDEQKKIKTSNIDAAWHLVIPKSEQTRLLNQYLNEGITDTARLDLIILTNDESLKPFAPSLDRFILTYQNQTFRVWRQK